MFATSFSFGEAACLTEGKLNEATQLVCRSWGELRDDRRRGRSEFRAHALGQQLRYRRAECAECHNDGNCDTWVLGRRTDASTAFVASYITDNKEMKAAARDLF